MKAICQICGELFAEVSIERSKGGDVIPSLRYPLTGAMFGSPDPYHGVPAPFEPSAEWQFMMCPYGRIHRPMVQDDLVRTEQGMVRLPKDGSPAFIDPAAGGEVDRSCLDDATVQVSDEEAERRVREGMGNAMEAGAAAVAGAAREGLEAGQPAAAPESEGRKDPAGCPAPGFTCKTCGRSFKSAAALKGHGKAHSGMVRHE